MPTRPPTFRLVPKAQTEKSWASRQTIRHAAYHSSAWRALRGQVLIRDCYLCQECKRQGRLTACGAYAQVHHIVSATTEDDVLCDESNLETLCASCHSRLTAGEESAFGKE